MVARITQPNLAAEDAQLPRPAVLYRLIGSLCLVYGSFVLLLVLIPNPPAGRLCFAFCGGAIFATGAILLYLARRAPRQPEAINPQARRPLNVAPALSK